MNYAQVDFEKIRTERPTQGKKNAKKFEYAQVWNFLIIIPLSDVMDIRHQSNAICIILVGGEDTHPWSATKVGNPIPATTLVDRYGLLKSET